MRVVIDTNVIVGASFKPKSVSGRLVRRVREGSIEMPWSSETRAEIESVVGKIPPLSGVDVTDLFRPEHLVDPPPAEDGLEWIPDPTDRKFAALARVTDAILVSNDPHLLDGRSGSGMEILTSVEFGVAQRGYL